MLWKAHSPLGKARLCILCWLLAATCQAPVRPFWGFSNIFRPYSDYTGMRRETTGSAAISKSLLDCDLKKSKAFRCLPRPSKGVSKSLVTVSTSPCNYLQPRLFPRLNSCFLKARSNRLLLLTPPSLKAERGIQLGRTGSGSQSLGGAQHPLFIKNR